jgi:hypothetical protein
VHVNYSGQEEIEDLIEEQRSLAHSKNPFERVVGSLCIGAILKERLVGLPNSTISQLMTDFRPEKIHLAPDVKLSPNPHRSGKSHGIVNQFAAERNTQELSIRYVSGPRKQILHLVSLGCANLTNGLDDSNP